MSVTSNYAKYNSKNPFVKIFIKRFLDRIVESLEGISFNKIIDVGCGGGVCKWPP